MPILDINNMTLVSSSEKKQRGIDPFLKVYRYQEDLYIIKPKKRDYYTDFNELFCQYLTPRFNLENAEYCYIRDNGNFLNENDQFDNYHNNGRLLLTTKNFKKLGYAYQHLSELKLKGKNFNDQYNSLGSTEKIEAMEQYFSNLESYQLFMEQLISLLAFDYYTNQIDRATSNMMFVSENAKPFKDFTISPIYDNERSLDFDNMLRIRSHFYNGEIYDDVFLDLIDRYPKGLAAFRSILDINIEEYITMFESTCYASLLDDYKKDHIKKIDDHAKAFVLKYIGR